MAVVFTVCSEKFIGKFVLAQYTRLKKFYKFLLNDLNFLCCAVVKCLT